VNVGLRVLTGIGVAEGALDRRSGEPQPKMATPNITITNNDFFCFIVHYPFPYPMRELGAHKAAF
jgi:hypothetical protein